MKMKKYLFSELIEEITELNTELLYGLDDIVGVTIEKGLIPTIANLTKTELNKFYIVKPDTFVFNPRTHGVRLEMGYNDTENTYITSWNNVAFKVKDEARTLLNPEYLWLYFNRTEWDRETNYHAWGSSTIVFSWNTFRNLSIKLPEKEVQDKIVGQYKVIKNRIKLKKQINDNLDDTAQTLYQKYFESNSDKSSWKQGTVGDVLQLQRGHDLPRTEMTGGKYPVAGSTGTIGYHDEFTAEAPVIVMGRSGNIGNPRLYLCNCWTHNTSLYVKQIYEAEPLWVFYLLKNLNYDGFVGGSAVPTLNRNDVHAYGIAIPPLELQKSFSQKVMSLIYCKEENLSEIEKLQELQKIILTTMSSR